MKIKENYPSTPHGLYRISPHLPVGIFINRTTGVISGVASIPQNPQKYEVKYTDKNEKTMITCLFISVNDENGIEEKEEELKRILAGDDDTEQFLSLFSSEDVVIVIDKSYKVNISKVETPITKFTSFYSLISQSSSLSPPIVTVICDSNQNYQLFGDLKNIYIANIYFNILSLDENDSIELLLNGIIKSLENSYLYNVHISIQNIESKEVILTCNSNDNYCGLLSSNIKNSTLFHVGFINDNNIVIKSSADNKYNNNNNNNNQISLLMGNIEDSNCYGCFINSNNDLFIKIDNTNSHIDSSVGLLVFRSVNSNFLYSFINVDTVIYINNYNNNQQLKKSISLFVNKMDGIESKILNCFVLVRNKLLIENTDFSGLIYSNNCNDLNVRDSFIEIHGIMISKENSFISSGFIYNSEGKSITMKESYIKLYFEDNSYGFDYYLFNYVRKSELNIKNCLFYINRNTVVDISGANNIVRNIETSYYITPNNNTIDSNLITEIRNINECKVLPSKFDLLISESSGNRDLSTIYNKEMPFYDISKSQISDITSNVNANTFLSVDIEFIKLNKILYSNLYGNIFTVNHNIPEVIYNDDIITEELKLLFDMNITVKYVKNSDILGKIDSCVLFSERINNIFVEHFVKINISKCVDIKSIKDGCRKYVIVISSNYRISFRICSEKPTTIIPTTTTIPTTSNPSTSSPSDSPTTTNPPTSTPIVSSTIQETTNPPYIEKSSVILELRIRNLTVDESNENGINDILLKSIIQIYKDNGIELKEDDIIINKINRRLLLRKDKSETTTINVIIEIEKSLFEELVRISNKISHNNILLYNILVSIQTENENPFKYTEIEIDYLVPTVIPTTPNPTKENPTTIPPTTPTTIATTKLDTSESNNSESVGEVNSGIVALVVIIVVIVVLIIIVGLLLQIYKQKYLMKAEENEDESEKKSIEEKKLKKMMRREKNKVEIEMARNNPI